MSAPIWDVATYAGVLGMTVQATLRRLKKAHRKSLEDGFGGWFYRETDKGEWRINVMMMARWRPGMLVEPSLADRVQVLESKVDMVIRRTDRMGAAMRHSSRPPGAL